jgi:hypothetical protein
MKDAGEEITDPRLKRIAAAQVCLVRVRALVMDGAVVAVARTARRWIGMA